MRLEVGCDIDEFKRYYRNSGIHEYLKAVGVNDVASGELGPIEEKHIKKDSSHLIVLREGNEIIGHAIWHEESVDGFKDPQDKETREALEKLLGGEKDFAELHELWLEVKNRGKGYGSNFFRFFEDFAREKGHNSIAYFTGSPAAIAICRARCYKEAVLSFPEVERWHVFSLSLRRKDNEEKSELEA